MNYGAIIGSYIHARMDEFQQ